MNNNDNGYVLDAETGAEMARLLDQERQVTLAMGGLLAEQSASTLQNMVDVLDLGCGPGGWVHDMAYTYPTMEVTGIDQSVSMITYAQAHAQVRQLPNAHFKVMDFTQPLTFADASFDLINARLLFAALTRERWLPLLTQCQRILRPNGIIRLTESEEILTNKASLETFFSLITLALQRAGYGFSSTGKHFSITPMLPHLLAQAGYTNLQLCASTTNFSAGTTAFPPYVQNFQILLSMIQPLLLKTNVATAGELNDLYTKVFDEMYEEDFCGIGYMLTVWGKR